MDAWRLLHPKGRDYSHFSKSHNSYSRIDNIFLDHFHLPLLRSACIGTATLSDHAPVSICLTIPDLPHRPNNWKLNDSLITNPTEVSILTKSLSQYFEENSGSDTSPSLLWEAHKALIRGNLIELGARKKREHGQQLKRVLHQIAELDKQHKLSLHTSHLEALTLKREELKNLLALETKRKFHYISQKVYEWGNKPGKMLARSLTARKTLSFIPKIKLPSGDLVHTTPQISKAFNEFHAALYNVEGGLASLPLSEKRKRILTYLREANLPKLSRSALNDLEANFSIEEFQCALKSSSSGKAPGPDGFTLLYYKTFGDILLPHLVAYANSVSHKSALRPESLSAHISHS